MILRVPLTKSGAYLSSWVVASSSPPLFASLFPTSLMSLRISSLPPNSSPNPLAAKKFPCICSPPSKPPDRLPKPLAVARAEFRKPLRSLSAASCRALALRATLLGPKEAAEEGWQEARSRNPRRARRGSNLTVYIPTAGGEGD